MSVYGKNPRGKYARAPLESEIRAAQTVAGSALGAAKLLGMCYNTYRKWAKIYGIHVTYRDLPGKRKPKIARDPTKGKYPLDDILVGKHPNYPTFRLKDKLFKTGYKEEKCEHCGWTHKRNDDGVGPFLVDYIDGDPCNKKLENIRILCLNCIHNLRGYIVRGKNLRKRSAIIELDVDRLQKEKILPKIRKNEEDLETEWNDREINLTEEEIRQLLSEDEDGTV